MEVNKQMIKNEVNNIFRTSGMPNATYVVRENGRYENEIEDALLAHGKVCIITGASKTGKTSLYTKVLSDNHLTAIKLRGGSDTRNDYYAQIQSAINGRTNNEDPKNMIDLMKEKSKVLVIEDFQYFNDENKKLIAMLCKEFVDEMMTVIVVTTAHRVADITEIRPDLMGRVSHVDVQSWRSDDLKEIAQLGFNKLEITIDDDIIDLIASESVGLPIITQSVCQRMVIGGLKDCSTLKEMLLTEIDVRKALNLTAIQDYIHFEKILKIFNRLLKDYEYQLWSKVVSAFMEDPIEFSLNVEQLRDRMERVDTHDDPGMHAVPVDTGALVTQMGLMPELKRQKPPLIEWVAETEELHIIEPTFLFYIRWKKPRTKISPVTQKSIEILKALRSYPRQRNQENVREIV